MTNNNVGELYRGMKERLIDYKNKDYGERDCIETVIANTSCNPLSCDNHDNEAIASILAALEDAYELGKLKNDYWCGSAFEKGAELGKEIGKEEFFAPLDADNNPCYMDEIIYHKGEEVRIVAISHKGNLSVRSTKIKGGHSAYWIKSTDVSHSLPVFDADGVKIEKGMKVWYCYLPSNKAPEEHIVTGFQKDIDNDVYVIATESGRWFLSSSIFANKPVFDANHERIKEGDTVWELRTHDKLVIESVHTKEEAEWYVDEEKDYVKFTDGCWAYAENVTHIEPDTQNKLYEDIDKFVVDNFDTSLHNMASNAIYDFVYRDRELCKCGDA